MRFTESQEEKMEVDLVERRGENTLLIRLSERSMNNKEVIFLPRSILFYLYVYLKKENTTEIFPVTIVHSKDAFD